MYLRHLRLVDFFPNELQSNPEMPNAFKVCCECNTENHLDAELLKTVSAMESIDRTAFMNGLRVLLKVANTGRLLETHYDKKHCHETHKFKHGNKIRKVMRIRTSDLRTLFFYGSERALLLIDAFPKHTTALSEAQKLQAEDIIKRFLDEKHIFVDKEASPCTPKT